MERTVLRILGKKGRTTIPWPIRAELDFCPGDVLLFEPDPPDRVIITRMEVYEPEEVEEPDLTGDIFTEEFHRLPLEPAIPAAGRPAGGFPYYLRLKGAVMATRKENIDIEYDEPQQEVVSGAAESNGPYESQDPADWGTAHDGTVLSHLQAQDQAACHRQRQHCQELRCTARPGPPW